MNKMALVGHFIHFSFSDLLEMELNEIEHFYEIAIDLNKREG
jgi:hypothetical protein